MRKASKQDGPAIYSTIISLFNTMLQRCLLRIAGREGILTVPQLSEQIPISNNNQQKTKRRNKGPRPEP